MAPKTIGGKILTVLYALIGIPIMLLCLANIGDLLAHSFKYLYANVMRFIGRKHRETMVERSCKRIHKLAEKRTLREAREKGNATPDITASLNTLNHAENNSIISMNNSLEMNSVKTYSFDQGATVRHPKKIQKMIDKLANEEKEIDIGKVTVPVTCCLLVLVGYTCLGALMFAMWEGWSFLDGSYFCFVTLTTIGLGDLIPGATTLQAGANAQIKLSVCGLYVLFGLALISMCFNLVQEEVAAKAKWAGKKLGIVKPDEKKCVEEFESDVDGDAFEAYAIPET